MRGSKAKLLRKLGTADYLRAHKIHGPNKMRSFKSYFRKLKKLYTSGGVALWQGRIVPS